MRSRFRQSIALLMLLFFVMSSGAQVFGPKWLAHELDHAREALAASTDHAHALQSAAQSADAPDPDDDVEHQLLHALSHCAQAHCSTLDGMGAPPDRIAPVISPVLAVLLTDVEPLFRPPRSTSLL